MFGFGCLGFSGLLRLCVFVVVGWMRIKCVRLFWLFWLGVGFRFVCAGLIGWWFCGCDYVDCVAAVCWCFVAACLLVGCGNLLVLLVLRFWVWGLGLWLPLLWTCGGLGW